LLSLDISSNSLFAEGTKLLAQALKGNQIMTALSISSNMMTYDGKKFGEMSGVAALADVIPGMGAMTRLNLASNQLYAEGTKLLAAALKGNLIIIELNISSDKMTWNGSAWGDMSGIIALADAIPDMGALTSLNLSSNELEAEGAKIVVEATKVTTCAIAIILAPFVCSSDHWLDCFCSLLSTGYVGVV
jgi:hypothetical protein